LGDWRSSELDWEGFKRDSYGWAAMLNNKKILLPIDFPDTSLRVVHQAAMLARHFHSEILMLHVVTADSHAAGVPEDGPEFARWDGLAAVLRVAQKHLDHTLSTELAGLTIRSILAKGDAARTIVLTAQREKADLIMMPSYGSAFNEFLLSSETAKAPDATECPVWTDAHVEELPAQGLAIQNVLCAVDFKSHDLAAVSWAARMAAQFGARLTLAHVTSKVVLWGPGGYYVVPRLKKALYGDASDQIGKLKKKMGIDAEVFIGSGDVPNVLGQAVKQTNADLLVTGTRPYGGHLRIHGYAIICAVPVPVLNV
jgi:nucleotide-binding universal stress UspA family protein